VRVVSHEFRVPEPVLQKVRALGTLGEQWLRDLPALIADVEREWAVEIGDALDGGTGAYVAPAAFSDGTDAIIKFAIPDGLEGHSVFARELQILLLAGGRPYVRVLRADEERRILVLERLGCPLEMLGLPVEAQIDAIAATLAEGWRRVDPSPPLRTGAEQAAFLHEFVASRWNALGRPCSSRVADRALHYAKTRRDAFDAAQAVLVHGDAHPANVLEALDAPGEFRLIDPDGMVSEPAHDAGLPLRDWSAELLAGDPVARGRAWCARMSERAGVDPQAMWEWAFLERVSSGLFLLQLGNTEGRMFLDVAERWMALP
jgi:streptomycin 6-kinase